MSTQSHPLVWTKQAILHEWTPDQLRKAMKDPAELQKLTDLINAPDEPETPVVTSEQQAELDAQAAAAAQRETEEAAARALAEETAEVARKAKEAADQAVLEEEAQYRNAGVRVIKDASGAITKIIKEYQAKDEKGNPIGRPTHLEARSWLELSIKQQTAHENAIRYAERIQKTKVTFKPPKPGLSDEELAQLQATLIGEDRDAANAAATKIRENNKVVKTVSLDEEKREVRDTQIAYKWMTDHLTDFYPCQANSDVLKAYLEENNLEFTYDNLEAAFTAKEFELAQRPTAPAVLAPVNPEPVAQPTAQPAPAAPAVAPAAAPQPAAAAPAAPAEPTNPEPPARRPGVNGGIVPGQNSGVRPSGTAQPVGLQWEDIKKWTGKQLREEMKKSPSRRAEIERVIQSRQTASR